MAGDLNRGDPYTSQIEHAKATKHDSRRSNLRTTLELVSHRGATSRADIARQTGLTRAAVSSLVGELMDSGLLQGARSGNLSGWQASDPARPQRAGTGHRRHRPGTSPVPGGSGRPRAEGSTRGSTPTIAGNPVGEAANEVAIELIADLIAKASAPVLGIGVGTPGVVDPEGRVLEAANLDWHGVDLASELRARFDIPVSIANDAQVAALAEFRRHPADHRNLLLVKLGTGVGAGVVLNGSLHKGEHSAAGEIGHVRVVDDGDVCRCGNRGCLETVASIPAILRRLGADPHSDPWDTLALAGRIGEEPVRRALAEVGRHLGSVLSNVIAMLDVGHLVLAPELLNAGDVLIAEVRKELSGRILPATADLLEIEVTQLGGDLVLAGAASAVLADRLGVVLR